MATYLDNLGENQFVVVRDINHPRQELLISAPYKKYVALLTQSGTDAPVATVLENTIGNIVWAREDSSNSSANLSLGFPNELKTFILVSSTNVFYPAYWVNDSQIVVQYVNDGDLYNFAIEIRVYN